MNLPIVNPFGAFLPLYGDIFHQHHGLEVSALPLVVYLSPKNIFASDDLFGGTSCDVARKTAAPSLCTRQFSVPSHLGQAVQIVRL